MNSIQSIPRKLALAIFAFVALFNTSFGASIGDMNKDALAAMKSGKWAEAQAILVKATNAYDSRAPQLYGPRFGWFWYHRGYCEIKLGMFDFNFTCFNF